MGFVDREQADFPATDPRRQLLELLHKGGPMLRVGFLEPFLAFLATAFLSPQDVAVQGRTAACVADALFKPASQFLRRPGMTRQAVFDRGDLDDGVDEWVEWLLVKRGKWPAVGG